MRAHRRPKKTGFPLTVTVKGYPGISAMIYSGKQFKGNSDGNKRTYLFFTVAYSLLGKRKRRTFSDLEQAKSAAEDAIKRIGEGQQDVLELRSRDRDIYLRAVEAVISFDVDLDFAVREYAEARTLLNGTGTILEAVRFFIKHQAKELPRITVPDAVAKCLAQARADGKSEARMHQLEHYLNAFAGDLNIDVAELTPGIVSRYLTTMNASERTKKNARDVIGYFGRWLVLHGYLPKGNDLTEGVQRYSMKPGEIHVFSPTELAKLLQHADGRLVPYIAIGAFAGLRGAEIQRLDWSEIDFRDGFIEVKAEKSKTDIRRLVPIQRNLVKWLKSCKKASGPVCPYKNVVNQLVKLVKKVNKTIPKGTPDKERVVWKKNALRHSYISYRVAECADVARVADESGNSPAVIKANYLKRVRPDQAKQWFNIVPTGTAGQVGEIAELPKSMAA